jgi:3-deoxy-manno-octulosonate cytidylyltransferase (CMP-KDO synthetase)
MSAEFRVVIPARFASTRLPGKPLAEINGIPMVVRVAAQAALSGALEVVVATDDERVVVAAETHGHRAVMTRVDHESGSDRVMEVAELAGWPDDALIVNVQGDEPLIPPSVIKQVADLLDDNGECDIATLCQPITEPMTLLDPNVVKVVTGAAQRALYFSRAPIPWDRTNFPAAGAEPPLGKLPGDHWWRHIGIYAFRLSGLRQFCGLPSSNLEVLESLEQLRALQHGMGIAVAAAVSPVPGGVDTPDDLRRVIERFSGPSQ